MSLSHLILWILFSWCPCPLWVFLSFLHRALCSLPNVWLWGFAPVPNSCWMKSLWVCLMAIPLGCSPRALGRQDKLQADYLWLAWYPHPSTWGLAWWQKMASWGSMSPITRSHCNDYFCRFLGVSTALCFHVSTKCPFPQFQSFLPGFSPFLPSLIFLIPNPTQPQFTGKIYSNSPSQRDLCVSPILLISLCYLASLCLGAIAWLSSSNNL